MPMIPAAPHDLASDERAVDRSGRLRHFVRVLWRHSAPRGGLIFVIASLGVNLSNFLFHIVLSRLLGPSSYGALGALLSVMSVLSVPLSAVQVTVAQSVARRENPTEAPPLRRLLRISTMAAAGGLAVWLAATPTIDVFFHLNSPADTIGAGLWLAPAIPSAVLEGVLIGQQRFRTTGLGQLVGALARLASGVALVEVGFGSLGGIVATVVASAVVLVVYANALRPTLLGGGRFVPRGADALLSTVALGGAAMLTTIDAWLARHFLAPHAAGLFVAAATAGNIVIFLPAAVTLVYFPQIAACKGRGRAARSALARVTVLVALLGVGAACVMASAPRFFVDLLFGSAFAQARIALGTVAAADALIGVAVCFLYFQVARGSRLALAAWPDCLLALGLAAVFHSSLEVLALDMLAAAGVLVAGLGVPTALAALRSLADETSSLPRVALPVEEADFDLTIVVPSRNVGVRRLGEHLQRIAATLLAAGVTFELVPVSDGSTDGSEAAFGALVHAPVRPIVWTENRGKGEALRAGLAAGRGRYLGFIDGDGDIPAYVLADFIALVRQEQPEIVVGSKRHRQSSVEYPWLRRVYSVGYQLLTGALFGLRVRDTQTGVKLIRRDVVAEVLPRMVEKRFAFDLELLAVARHLGYRQIVELPVRISRRFPSTISLPMVWRMLQDTLATFWRLWVLRFYDAPLLESRVRDGCTTSDLDELLAQGVPLRILVCNWRDLAHPFAGGAEVYTHRVATEWAAAGHEVTWFCAAVAGRPSRERVDGITIIRRGGRLSVYREARRFYKRFGVGHFDLVVDEVNTRPFQAAAWSAGTPVVALVHQIAREVWFYELPFPLALVGRYVLEPRWLRRLRSVPVFTVSESSETSLAEFGLSDVTVIPEGIDPVDRTPVDREGTPTVVFVGRLAPNKRPDHAVEAFRILRQRVPKARLWVVGDGPMAAELARAAPEGVELLGRLPESEKRERLARAHCLVATGAREGWGLTVTEAAQAGTPTIAYDVAGLRDSVKASGGLVVPPRPAALAAALAEQLPTWARDGVPPVAARGVLPWDQVARRLLEGAVGRVTVRRAAELRGDDITVAWRRALAPIGALCDRHAWSVAGIAALVALAPLSELGLSDWVGAVSAGALVCLAIATLGAWADSAPRPVLVPEPSAARSEVVSRRNESTVSGEPRASCGQQGVGAARRVWKRWAAVPVVGVLALLVALVGSVVTTGVLESQPVPATGTAWFQQLRTAFASQHSEAAHALVGVLEFPLGVTGSLLRLFGGSAGLDERLWVMALFAGVAMTMTALLVQLELGFGGSIVGGMVYLLSPYVFTMTNLHLAYLAAMAFVPGTTAWLLWTARPDVGRRRLTWGSVVWALCAALALGIVAESPPLLVVCAAAMAGGLLLVAWLQGRGALGRVLHRAAPGFLVLLFLSSFWLVPFLPVLISGTPVSTAAHRSWQWAGTRSTLANTIWLNTSWNWTDVSTFPYAAQFDRFPLVLWRYAVPIGAFSMLGVAGGVDAEPSRVRRQLRLVVFAAAVALFAIVVATGNRAPGAPLFHLLTALPFGWLFENPGRFLFVADAAYALLVSIGVESLLTTKSAGGGATPADPGPWRFLRPASIPVALLLVLVAPVAPLLHA